MYYKHGTFSFEDGEVELRGSSKVAIPSARGRPMLYRVTYSLGFYLIADGQSAVKTRWDAIRTALNSNYVDSGFMHDDDTQSFIWLSNSESFSGVTVSQYPSAQPVDGADYATGHAGVFSVTADFVPADAFEILDYRESYTVQGNGGPLVVEIITDTSLPYYVQTANYTGRRAVQSGYCVGRSGWPSANAPMWTTPILQNPSDSVTLETPRVMGNGLIEYRTSWNYQFASDGNLSAQPTIR